MMCPICNRRTYLWNRRWWWDLPYHRTCLADAFDRWWKALNQPSPPELCHPRMRGLLYPNLEGGE